MITKIRKIQNFGSYRDYCWGCTSDFDKTNLIYGWNYSGKTTLSRLFRSIGGNTVYYQDCCYEIESNSGVLTEKTQNAVKICVFNRDYVEDNIEWISCETEPFAIIGESNIELAKELELRENELAEIDKQIDQLSKKKEHTFRTLEKELTDYAREIKNDLGISNYDKTKLRADLDRVVDYNLLIIKDDDRQSLMKTIHNNEQKRELSNVCAPKLDLDQEYQIVRNLSHQIVPPNNNIPEDSESQRWIRKGLDLNKNRRACLFCGSPLNQKLIERYYDFFTGEYRKILDALNNEKQRLDQAKQTAFRLEKEQFYPAIGDRFDQIKEHLIDQDERYNLQIDKLIKMIDLKLSSLFDDINCEEFQFDYDESPYICMNELIHQNNEMTRNYKEQQENARVTLLGHKVALFYRDHDYSNLKSDQSKITEEIKTLEEQKDVVCENLQKIREQMRSRNKAINGVNGILSDYYGNNEIKIEERENKFYIYRGTELARNMSEGEQTAIAFALFITHLEQYELGDLTVFIDDPISSLDSNNIYSTYSLIKNRLYNSELDNKTQLRCEQLFISTHNFEFFNLLKKDLAKGCKYYLVRRVMKSGVYCSMIDDMPIELINNDSEYTYLWSRVYYFIQNEDPTFDQQYDLPNMLRKILEMYSSFRYQQSFAKCKGQIFTRAEAERVYKFVNNESHGHTDYLIKHAELSESREVATIVIRSLESKDSVHMENVRKAIGITPR